LLVKLESKEKEAKNAPTNKIRYASPNNEFFAVSRKQLTSAQEGS